MCHCKENIPLQKNVLIKMYINFIKFIYVIEDLWSLKQEILRNLSVGVINIEYENIKFENGNIEKQSGELKVKFGVMRKWVTSQSNVVTQNWL